MTYKIKTLTSKRITQLSRDCKLSEKFVDLMSEDDNNDDLALSKTSESLLPHPDMVDKYLLDQDIKCVRRRRQKLAWVHKMRTDDKKREAERIKEKEHKNLMRANPEIRQPERKRELIGKQSQRAIPERYKAERILVNKYRQEQRAIPEKRQVERKRELIGKQLQRAIPERAIPEKRQVERKRELIGKQLQRSTPEKKQAETLYDRNRKKVLRKQPLVLEMERVQKQAQRSYRHIHSLEKTRDRKRKSTLRLSDSFIAYETNMKKQKLLRESLADYTGYEDMKNICLTNYVSVNELEWICLTCSDFIKKNSMPTLSVYNGLYFPQKPNELDLFSLEERLIAPQTICSLPRNWTDTQTLHVQFKRRNEYKSTVHSENVRPAKIQAAFQWLMENSLLYMSLEIQYNPDWFDVENTEVKEYLEEHADTNNSENGITDILSPDNKSKETDGDKFCEIDDTQNNTGNLGTLLIDESDRIISFAPGQNQIPLSIFKDDFAEELAFPTIFCGQKRLPNTARIKPVHYSQICKWELCNVDRRAAMSVPNLFFKTCKLQLQQVSGKVSFAVRRFKTKGKTLKAGDLCKESGHDNFVNLDDGYYIFKTLRNSPAYLESKKKHVFAMIRQLGLPTWFISLSAADTKWVDLLKILGKLIDKTDYSDNDIEAMDWQQRSRLIKSDPVTCARFFDHRVHNFIEHVLKSAHNPIGEIQDMFYRIEMQQRGSAHIHMIVWIKDAPKFGEQSNEEIATWLDQFVSCTSNVLEFDKEFVNLQKHKHSKTCKKYNKPICRFCFPLAPMSHTTILEPFEVSKDKEEKARLDELHLKVTNLLNEDKEGLNMSFSEFLSKLELDNETYLKVISSKLKTAKVFLKRDPCDIRINPYFKKIISAWQANHDLQFVLDPYATAMYIVSYINKSQKGMSPLMERACKEAKEGNMDIRQKVRHIGNKFLNSVEVCAQEAAYLTLGLPLTKSTRAVVFINTSPADERTYLLKSMEDLEHLDPSSSDISYSNIMTDTTTANDYESNLYEDEEQEYMGNEEDFNETENDLTERLKKKCANGMTIVQRKPGGAGVGKSVVIHALYQSLQRYLCSSTGQDFTNMRILLCAPIGNAAFNIKGVTLHKAFALPVSQGKIKDLSPDVLNTYAMKRLQQIKGNKSDFGGVSLIVVGDLFQLQPVFDDWIFNDLKDMYGPLATNLWQKHFFMYELTDIMRQKDDQEFAFLLNRIREGEHTQADVNLIKTRIIEPTQWSKSRELPHLCALNRDVACHNSQTFEMATGQKVIIHAIDAVQGNINSDTKARILKKLSSPSENNNNKTAGLHTEVKLAVGLLYSITVNLAVEDGLTNGVTCTLKHIDYHMQNSNRSSILWVLFYDQQIGIMQRTKYSMFKSNVAENTWTPIFDTKRSFQFSYSQSTGGLSVIRIQFPLAQAAARSVHKAQGSTLSEVCLDLNSRRKWTHLHYVALSRVTKLSGLHLKDFDESKIAVSSDTILQMETLRREKLIKLTYTPVYKLPVFKLIFHNAL
ncbi:uncharacterized protein LOC141898976 [Tubulanus polymorphus]|uniref:uncharacterized protein LOC141898976 n=1 Tax=Tubulanus polymorphus TaxID=672921 RepID=UPI003DA6773E